MKHLLLAVTLFIPSSACLVAQTRHATLSINSFSPRPVLQTNSFTIGPNETAELVAFPANDSDSYIRGHIDVQKDGSIFSFSASGDLAFNGPQDMLRRRLIVSGPAVVFYRSTDQNQKCFVTFRITPDAFPPDKTFIIPDGAPGATVTLECSTNLLTWATTTNGFYTGTNGAKFFRINAQRTP